MFASLAAIAVVAFRVGGGVDLREDLFRDPDRNLRVTRASHGFFPFGPVV